MVDARLFQALSDPTRLKILLLLSRSIMNVTNIVNEVKATQPAVSRHLRVLREASLINHVRKGKEVEYSLNLAQLRDAKLYIEALAGGMGKGEGPKVVEIALPAREPAAGPMAVPATAATAAATTGARSQKTRARRKPAKAVKKPAARPAPKEPGKPATVTATTDYVIEREEVESMDDFLL
jgi:DNA-binding transcriptional ArsR family regulator